MKIKLLGLNNKEYCRRQINICGAAGKLSRMEGTVFDALDVMKDYDKALKFIKRVIAMGHTSTVDHDYFVFALSGVSPLVEQTIIAERFSSFTIKSRREVNFSKAGFYTPIFRDKNGEVLKNNESITKEYKKHMKSLFQAYQYFVDNGIKMEDARFILPYSYHSEIIMGLDATSLTRMINYLTKSKLSRISELKELGEKLYEVSIKRAPYLDELISNEMYEDYKLEEQLNSIVGDVNYDYLDSPSLISYTENVDETLITNAISRIYSMSWDDSKKIYDEKIFHDEELKNRIMKNVFLENEHNDLRQINFRFQLSVPFSILTHYTRHRRLELSIPDFRHANLLNYVTPPSIKANKELNDFYESIFKENYNLYLKFKNMGVCDEDLVYFTLSGNFVNVIINFDGEAFRWICRLRECTKAQWCIRNSVTKMHRALDNLCPLYSKNLGPDCVVKHVCGEGKESCGRINSIVGGE